ncbi:hypothetical protein [Natrinema gelatinilyticum]|nr:hypothetical protein [Natrinema gelatinilyticum]
MALESHCVHVFSSSSKRESGRKRRERAGVGDQQRRPQTGFGFFFAR